MPQPHLDVFRHASFLILLWQDDRPAPRDCRILIDRTHELPRPYLALVINPEPQRLVYLARADSLAPGDRAAVTLIDCADETHRATRRKARIPTLRQSDLAGISPTERKRLIKGLAPGLAHTFPELDNQATAALLRMLTGDVAPSSPSHLPAPRQKESSPGKPKPAGDRPVPVVQLGRSAQIGNPASFVLTLEHCGYLRGAGLYLTGYHRSATDQGCRLSLHTPGGVDDLTDWLITVPRPDLSRRSAWNATTSEITGFECFFPTSLSPAALEQTYLAAATSSGELARVALKPVIDLTASRDILDQSQAFRLFEGFIPILAPSARPALQPLLARLGDWLRSTQSGLRIRQGERLEDSVHLQFDFVLALPGQHLYLCGWLVDMVRNVVDIRLFTLSGDSIDLNERLPNTCRPDVLQALRQQGLPLQEERVGFQLRLDLPRPFVDDAPLYVRLQLRNGSVHRLAIAPRRYDPTNPLPLIRELLGSFPTWEPQLFDLYDQAIGPTIADLWAQRSRPRGTLRIETFGPVVERPPISVIVPLYRRIDLVSFQLAQFAEDPDFLTNELIYVLDDPALYQAFSALCRREYPLFRVPFRTLFTGANQGYAGATNLGAAEARGQYVLLLNSDVLPCTPGWSRRLAETFERLDRPGVLGPKLLFPDGVIQHAGMNFFQEPTLPGFWFNDHPDKGLPNQRPPHAIPIEVPAVTGACMLLERTRFIEMGGLSDDYILGDFEDSDLCLRLQAAGHRVWYTPEVELFHLERQSFRHAGELGWRTNLSRYNAWVQTHRWGGAIAARMAQTTNG